MKSLSKIAKVLGPIRKLAVEYRKLTGKPLGVTSELGEVAAAARLGLTLAPARTAGYDATRKGKKFQIKCRCIPKGRPLAGQKLGAIRLDRTWDVVVLVLLDDTLKPTAMYEAKRSSIEAALKKTNSKARQRGALTATEFVRIGKRVWPYK